MPEWIDELAAQLTAYLTLGTAALFNVRPSVFRAFIDGLADEPLNLVELGLTGELFLWAKEQNLDDDDPVFFSGKTGVNGSRRALQRGQAWVIVKEASGRANVCVLALRASKHGPAAEAAPVHPHLFRHARVRQIVRATRNLPLAQRQPVGVVCKWRI